MVCKAAQLDQESGHSRSGSTEPQCPVTLITEPYTEAGMLCSRCTARERQLREMKERYASNRDAGGVWNRFIRAL